MVRYIICRGNRWLETEMARDGRQQRLLATELVRDRDIARDKKWPKTQMAPMGRDRYGWR